MAPPVRRIQEIEIDLIDVGAQQIRETPEDESIGELAESIAAKGLLQPIGVTNAEGNRYQLRWGHRRLLAHLRLRRRTILATVYEGTEESVKGLALVENLHRTEMPFKDEVTAVCILANDEGKSIEQIASIVNKSRQWVLNRLMAPHLPDFLREPYLEGAISTANVELIARVPDESAQRYLTSMSVANRWTKAQLKTIAECYMSPVQQPEQGTPNTPGVNPSPVNRPFLYTCEVCHEQGQLQEFDLVRVHKDGIGCRTNPDRSNPPSGGNDELDSHQNGRDRNDDHPADRTPET